jgi:hypothetical protein
MKRLLLVLAAVTASFAVGCNTATKDGASIATAVVLDVGRQSEISAAEWAWIEKTFPGARRPKAKPSKDKEEEVVSFAHSVQVHHGKTYSCILIELPDGRERTVYFDITKGFGK